MSKTGAISKCWHIAKKIFGQRNTLLAAEVAAGRVVFATTLELEQPSLKKLRFRMRGIGPLLDLQLEWGIVVQAKLVGGSP